MLDFRKIKPKDDKDLENEVVLILLSKTRKNALNKAKVSKKVRVIQLDAAVHMVGWSGPSGRIVQKRVVAVSGTVSAIAKMSAQ